MSLSDLIEFFNNHKFGDVDSKTAATSDTSATSLIYAGLESIRPATTVASVADYDFYVQEDKSQTCFNRYECSSSESLETVGTQQCSGSSGCSTQKSITIEKCEWLEIALDQTDEESNVMLERYQSFITKGLTVDQAREAAQLLLYRDRDYDDRRSCAECAMYNFGCNRGLEPVGGGGVEVLHRCKGFADDNF
jgi:hypothetical protein